MPRLTLQDAQEIQVLLREGYPARDIASEYGVSDKTIRRIGWGQWRAYEPLPRCTFRQRKKGQTTAADPEPAPAVA